MISKILIMLVLIPALSFGQSDVTNQRLFDTISFIHDHYERKVEAFEKEPIVFGKIIF